MVNARPWTTLDHDQAFHKASQFGCAVQASGFCDSTCSVFLKPIQQLDRMASPPSSNQKVTSQAVGYPGAWFVSFEYLPAFAPFSQPFATGRPSPIAARVGTRAPFLTRQCPTVVQRTGMFHVFGPIARVPFSRNLIVNEICC
jgi:hypothetical protein